MMMNAKTPEERNALMAGHMKAMQDGMGMMKGISGKGGKGPMGGTGGMGAMTDPKGMPADMAKHPQMMERHMDMMQMMMDRLPSSPAKQ